MKKILITLFVVLGAAYWLLGQSVPCPQDTLLNGGGSHNFAYSAGEIYQGSCNFGCNADRYKCWQMPPNMDTQINVCGNVSPPFSDIAVVITSECRWITYASCQAIGDPIMAPFAMQAFIEGNMQLCAYWNSADTDSVGAFVKGFTISAPELNIIGDMDTCGVLLNTEPARETTQVIYKRLDDGKTYELPLRAGIYVAEPFFPARRKKICVIE